MQDDPGAANSTGHLQHNPTVPKPVVSFYDTVQHALYVCLIIVIVIIIIIIIIIIIVVVVVAAVVVVVVVVIESLC